MYIRRSEERGHANHGWLDSHHTFSFAGYFDRRFMGFSHLRVINEDRVAPGMGFGTHPHRDMEIISYVLEGALEHKDSMGTGSVIRPGEVQVMSAGTGVRHSEFNASQTEPVHFLQIWIEPAERGTEPRYDQKAFDPSEKRNDFRLIVSPDGAEGSLVIGQNARIYRGLIDAGESVSQSLEPGRAGWLHVARGSALVNGEKLGAGDAAVISPGEDLVVKALDGDAEVLFFDLLA